MTDTFCSAMRRFFTERAVHDVVELCSDGQLLLANRLVPSISGKWYSVNFAADHARMDGWYELLEDIVGAQKVVRLSGNVVGIDTLLADRKIRPDVILLQNAFIAPDIESLQAYGAHRRGENPLCQSEYESLLRKFAAAQNETYSAAVRTEPRYIITFGRPAKEKHPDFLCVPSLLAAGITPDKIVTRELVYDHNECEGEQLQWECVIAEVR